MNLRKTLLQPGWYFQNPLKIGDFLQKSAETGPKPAGRTIAAVAPHAGWHYSGSLAAWAVAALGVDNPQFGIDRPGTIAIIGGHLPEGMPALFAMEDAADTPLGGMEIDGELRGVLLNNFQSIPGFKTAEDRYQDNTVEVLLPMVKYFFPEAMLLWARFPADILSFNAGKILARTAASLDRELLVLGSTDLTHYGAHYHFCPHGTGQEALDWVKTVNDRRFIGAVEAGDPSAVLNRAGEEHSACSAGAVLGVMGYAEEFRAAGMPGSKGSAAELLAYGTSADISIEDEGVFPDSFVGYGAFVFTA